MRCALSRRFICTAAAVMLGGLMRGVLEDRVERQAPLIVRSLRARLESGNPPDDGSGPFENERSGVH